MEGDWLLKIRTGRPRSYSKSCYDDFHAGKTDFDKLLKDHRRSCGGYMKCKRELKKPFVKKTGEPWAESTLRTKRTYAGGWKRSIMEHKILIRAIMNDGYGPHKKKAAIPIPPEQSEIFGLVREGYGPPGGRKIIDNVVKLFPSGRRIPTTDKDSSSGKTTKLLYSYVRMYLDSANEVDSLRSEVKTLKNIIAGYRCGKPAPILKLIPGGKAS